MAGAAERAPGLLSGISTQLQAVGGAIPAANLPPTQFTEIQLDTAEAIGKANRALKSWRSNLGPANKATSVLGVLLQNLETNAVLALGPLSGVGARIRAIGVLARRGNVGLIAFSLGIALVAVAAIALITAMIKVRKSLEPVEGRLRAVTGSALLARLELDELQKLALKTGLGIGSLTNGFSRLAAAARGTSLEGEGIRRVFEGVTLAAAALRLSTEDTEGILRAFEQALTKGVLRAEEFNQQLGDRLPGAAVLAAKAINKTKQQFQAMLVAGEIITEEFLPKLTEQFENLFSEEAARNVETLTGALKQVGTAFSIFFDTLESRLGIVEKLTPLLNRFADALVELAEKIDTPLAKARRSLRLFQSDILGFELGGILQTEKDKVVKLFTDLKNELQKELEAIQAVFIAAADADSTKISLIELSDILAELSEKDTAIRRLAAALAKLNEFAIKPLAEVTGPDISKITKAFEKFTRAAATESKKTGEIIAGSLFGAEFQVSLLKAQDKLSKFSKNVVVEFAIANKVISEGLGKAFKEGTDIQRAQAFAEILGVMSDKFATVIQSAKDFKAIGKIFEANRLPLEKFNVEMAELVRLQEKFGESDALSRAMDKLKEDLVESDEFLSLFSDSFKELGRTIVDVIAEGANALETFTDFAKNLLKQILEIAIQLAIINPLLNSLFGGSRKEGFGGFLGSLAALVGGGGGGGVPISGGGPGGMPIALAHGGSFTVGGVGGVDKNPVKLNLSRGEKVTVTPAGASGDRQLVINFNFPPGTNVKEFGDSQSQIAAMVANTVAAASASNN